MLVMQQGNALAALWACIQQRHYVFPWSVFVSWWLSFLLVCYELEGVTAYTLCSQSQTLEEVISCTMQNVFIFVV